MSFTAWCANQSARIDATLTALYFDFQRRQFVDEWRMEKARLWRSLESQVGPGIAREIREWRTEP